MIEYKYSTNTAVIKHKYSTTTVVIKYEYSTVTVNLFGDWTPVDQYIVVRQIAIAHISTGRTGWNMAEHTGAGLYLGNKKPHKECTESLVTCI